MLPSRRRPISSFQLLLLLILVIYAGKLAFDLRGRVIYPWDILTCFETPFLNSMLKLHNGLSIYSAPELGSSEVYPPGVDYITYFLLRPFGAEIDIRWCRFVAVLLTPITAGIGAWCAAALLRQLRPERRLELWTRVTLLLAFTLMLHKSMTSDQPHPDNLHVLHAVTALALVIVALERGSFGWAVLAVAWTGLSPFTKQTAMLAPLGVLGALLLGKRWTRREIASFAMVAVVGPVLAVWWMSRGFGWFHLFQAASGHPFINVFFFLVEPLLDGGKLSPLIFPPRPLLLMLTPVAVVFVFTEKRARPWLLAWAAIGVFEAAPALLALLKAGGNFNNLGVIDFWLLLIVFPAAICGHADLEETRAPQWRPAATNVLTAMVLLALTLSLYPLKLRPHADAFAFGYQVEGHIRASLAAGERVWVPTGLMFLVRAGYTKPVEDLSINIWTADEGRDRNLQIHERLATKFYDRVYWMFPWDLPTRNEVDRYYERVDHVAGCDGSMGVGPRSSTHRRLHNLIVERTRVSAATTH